jgi:hypothetical protein
MPPTVTGCVALQLTARRLLDQVEVTADLHELDIEPGRRGLLSERILE